MKKNYVTPAIKAANIVISQIVMTSGGSGGDDPLKPDPTVTLPFIGGEEGPEDEGFAD